MRRILWGRNPVSEQALALSGEHRRPSCRAWRGRPRRRNGWKCRFEPLEERFLLSLAPGIDDSLWQGDEARFLRASVPVACHEAAPAPASHTGGLFVASGATQMGVFDFSFQGVPTIEQLDGGVIVGLAGEQTWVSSGDPVMPVRQSTILLPQGTEIISLVARYLDAGVVIAQGVKPIAAPAAVPSNGGGWPDVSLSYVRSSFGEAEAARYANHTILGYNVATLSIFPVEYDAAADTLLYHSRVSVTVTAGASHSGGGVSIRNSEADRHRVLQLVDNPQMGGSYEAPLPISGGGTTALPAPGPYQYVIITSAGLEDSFEALASQKQSRGLSATIVTTEYIATHYAGTETGDAADRIRNFIADAYANWGTRWVLLGGDREIIPERGVYASVGSTIDTHLPTDMYYACLDGPWNGDGDTIWGESNDGAGGGDIDLAPEVFIGRAPVSSAAEAANFVFKTIRYETTPHANATTAVWLGEQLDDTTWGDTSGIAIADRTIPDHWNLIERYDSVAPWTGAELIADLGASPHLVNHLGHANETYNARLVNANVAGLTNQDPYFMYSQGCMSGSFDTRDISIAEQHVISPHGAFGVVMNSRYGWYVPGSVPGASHYYALEFWDAVFNEGLLHLGEVNQDSKLDNLFRVGSTGVYRWIHFETNLFGDPETPFQIGGGPGGGEIRGAIFADLNADAQRQPGEPALQGELVYIDLNGNGRLDLGTISVASTEGARAIPDGGTLRSTLLVSGGARISDLNVTVNITHTYDSDLEVALLSPAGTRVPLLSHVGGWGDNFTLTTLDDEAPTAIGDGAAPFTGSFRPEGLLSRFDAEDANGVWTLEIADTMAWDTGTLDGWSLEFTFEEPSVRTAADGTYVFGQLQPGAYHVRHEIASGWTHTNPADGTRVVGVQQGAVVEGVDFLATQAQAPPPATELGAVDFLEIADLDLSGGDVWYVAQTARQGYLTVEALVQGAAELEITLYDAELNELGRSSPNDLGERIDWIVGAGQTFYLRLSGDAAGSDLRLANLVRREGGELFVYGTAGDDRLDFAAAAWHQVTINGVHYAFASGEVWSLEFDAGGGDDTAVLVGSTGADTAVVSPFSATLTGPGYQAVIVNTADIIILGQGGSDLALLYDSAGDDSFVATPDYARLFGAGFFNQVSGFRAVYAYATSGGTDVARLYDSPGNDTFVGKPEYGKLYGETFSNLAASFRWVYAYARAGGCDVARLYGSPGTDTFVGKPEYGKLYGETFSNLAASFRSVYAYATPGGNDVAKLYDSPGNDTFVGKPEYGKLYGDGFLNLAASFRSVYAYATAGGGDVAKLYDSPGSDTFVATPEYGKLYGDRFFNLAYSFRYVYAYATAGGTDVARLYGSSGNDTFVSTPEYNRLYGDRFSNLAASFRYVQAYAGAGGYDRAFLYDSSGDDYLEAAGDTAAIFGAGRAVWAYDFAWVCASSSRGGSDSRRVETIDYVLEMQGSWTDV